MIRSFTSTIRFMWQISLNPIWIDTRQAKIHVILATHLSAIHFICDGCQMRGENHSSKMHGRYDPTSKADQTSALCSDNSWNAILNERLLPGIEVKESATIHTKKSRHALHQQVVLGTCWQDRLLISNECYFRCMCVRCAWFSVKEQQSVQIEKR